MAVSPKALQKKKKQEPRKTALAVVAEALAPQLGSSPEFLMQMTIDDRKLAVLNDYTAAAVGYWRYRAVYDKVRFWDFISTWELVSSQAKGGLARQHILKALAAAAGVTSQVVARRPNIVARNIWDKNWKAKAVERGEIVMDE